MTNNLQISMRGVALSYGISFALFMVVSWLVWGFGQGSPGSALLSPAYPFLSLLENDAVSKSTQVSTAIIILLTFVSIGVALRKHRGLIVIAFSHAVLGFYWLWSFALMGAGA